MSKIIPECLLILPPDSQPSLTLDFVTGTGRLYGFPYAHLLSFQLEKNPDVALRPEAPADRFSFFFSGYEVRLLGWRLAGIVPFLRHATLASITAIEARYYGLSEKAPFIAAIEVIPNK